MVPASPTNTASLMEQAQDVPGRWWVFYPEQPESWVNVSGARLVQFRCGRLVSDVDRLTEDDRVWFLNEIRKDVERGRRPRFILVNGAPQLSVEVMMELTERVTMTCTRKAWASNATKIMDDVRFSMAAMFSVDEAQPAPQVYSEYTNTQRVLQRMVPSAIAEDLGFQHQVKQEQQLAEDDQIIQEALKQGVDDTPTPEPTGQAANQTNDPNLDPALDPVLDPDVPPPPPGLQDLQTPGGVSSDQIVEGSASPKNPWV